MKFYDNDNDLERAKEKYRVISDVVKEMRRIDPTRPICFDSNYQAKGKKEKYGADFMNTIDDGDIDDMHAYYNWYDYSLFRFSTENFRKGLRWLIVRLSVRKCQPDIRIMKPDILRVLIN